MSYHYSYALKVFSTASNTTHWQEQYSFEGAMPAVPLRQANVLGGYFLFQS